jgi:hypothetical protein
MKTKKDQTLRIIHPDGVTVDVVVTAVECFHKLQTFVGGMVTFVNLPHRKVLVVNEEGLLKRMPPNMEASVLAGQLIVGTAVLCDKSALA